jgi:uncharacterized protein with von Willebrand factor type A (vWA) domain
LKGLISLRLLAKDKPASSEAEAEGQPLDPKKTLREQGVFDGCDILVTQVRRVSRHRCVVLCRVLTCAIAWWSQPKGGASA